MAMMRSHAWLVMAWSCLGEGPEQPAPTACAEAFPADCHEASCCNDPELKCFQKHQWYAGCFERCTPGQSPENPDGEEWTCKVLDRSVDDAAGSEGPQRLSHDRRHRNLMDKPAVKKLRGEDVLALADGFVETAAGEPVKGKALRPKPAASKPKPAPVNEDHKSTNKDQNITENGAKATCSVCAPQVRDVPDVVIPFYERDLCKVGYTVQSIAVHDRHGLLGNVILMWVSTKSIFEYQGAVDRIQGYLSGSHEVTVVDFSPQVNSEGAGGWFAQQVFKLKVASMVKSKFYVVMDSKNTIIRDIQPQLFFTECNQGKIFGDFKPDEIPEPHATWYEASAEVLNVQSPREAGGKWPTSITPMLIHKQTVLQMLSSIGENPSVDSLCAGPLCDMLGMHSVDGSGATEFTMYVLAAKSRPDMDCDIAIVPPAPATPPAISLWRGEEDQIEINAQSCADIASGKKKAFMFGAQYQSLDNLPEHRREDVEGDFLRIFEHAKMYNASVTSTHALIQCIAGDLEGQAGPIFDKLPGDVAGEKEEDSSDDAHIHEDEALKAQTVPFCCTSAADSIDMCGTCYPGAAAGPDKFCGQSQDNCAQCGDSVWCESDVELGPVAVIKAERLAPLSVFDTPKVSQWGVVIAVGCLVALSLALLIARRALEQSHRPPTTSQALIQQDDFTEEVLW